MLILFLLLLAAPLELQIRFVGNEGFVLTDGTTTLVTDLPYQPGAFGYMDYAPEALQPEGRVVSIITHRHDDHFSPALFLARDWEIIGPEEVTSKLPAERVIPLAPRITVGDFVVEPFRTSHANTEHYSYLITWHGQRLYFVGDTEDPSHLLAMEDLDVAFVTPWLGCAAAKQEGTVDTQRTVLYHHYADGRDRTCGTMDKPRQGDAFILTPASN